MLCKTIQIKSYHIIDILIRKDEMNRALYFINTFFLKKSFSVCTWKIPLNYNLILTYSIKTIFYH